MAQGLKFERWTWSREAAHGLKVAVGKDGAFIAEEVTAGISKLWRINHGEAWLVTREESEELVIVCLEGKGARAIIPAIIERAKLAGFKSMRAHTQRPGLLRMFKRFGVYQKEIVLGLEL